MTSFKCVLIFLQLGFFGWISNVESIRITNFEVRYEETQKKTGKKHTVNCNLTMVISVAQALVPLPVLINVNVGTRESFKNDFFIVGLFDKKTGIWRSSNNRLDGFCPESCRITMEPPLLTPGIGKYEINMTIPDVPATWDGYHLGYSVDSSIVPTFPTTIKLQECPSQQNTVSIKRPRFEACGCGCIGERICPEGFYVVGDPFVKCLTTAKWDMPKKYSLNCKPECRAVQGGIPVVFSDKPCVHKCKGNYTCPKGYFPRSFPPITFCNKKFKWNLTNACLDYDIRLSVGCRNRLSFQQLFTITIFGFLSSRLLTR